MSNIAQPPANPTTMPAIIPRFAPVIPISVAERLAQRSPGFLGNYHLLLAHDVAANQKRYADVYKGITHIPDDVDPGDPFAWGVTSEDYGIIIMDNSVIELGQPVGSWVMRDACDAVDANVVCLPDYLLDREKTVLNSLRAFDKWRDIFEVPGRSAMVIPQGKDLKDWAKCLEEFADLDQVEWIGIPRNIRKKLGHSRHEAVLIANTICPKKKLHMFGFSDDLMDDIISTKFGRGVWGIDSAAPIWQAMRDSLPISLSQDDPGSRGDWWDYPDRGDDNIKLAAHNIKRVREWLADLPQH